MPNIKLQSCDKDIFIVDYNIAKCSATIKTMVENLGLCLSEGKEDILSLPNVNSAMLKKVIQWATYHKDDQAVVEDENGDGIDICGWDADFLKLDQGTLFELIFVANYLDIKCLVDVGCKAVANMMKGKRPEEIRKTFNIKNDFSPDEEEEVKKQNDWCVDK